MKKIRTKISSLFFLNTRALGCMRIGLALIILIDIATQVPFLTELFTNEGILPPAHINAEFPHHNLRTIHTLSGEIRYLILLLIIQSLITILRGLGRKTSSTTILVWFLTYSLHNANPLYQYGFDELLHITLFRSIFLPLGQSRSIDAKKTYNTRAGTNHNFSSRASIGLILHLIGLYTTAMGLRRAGIQEATNHTRLYNILHHSYMIRPLGERIRQSLTLSQLLLRVTIIVESMLRIFWLIPSHKNHSRNISVGCFILRHLGLAVTMDVGLFPVLSMSILLGLLSFNQTTNSIWEKNQHRKSTAFIVIICYTIIWNINLVSTQKNRQILPDSMYKFSYILGLQHNRGLFQGSGKDYTRYIITGINQQGEAIDIIQNKKVTDFYHIEFPDTTYYHTHRHIKLFQSIPRYPWIANFISYYYCHQYSDIHTISIQEFSKNIPQGYNHAAKRKIINTYDCQKLQEVSPHA